MKHFSTKISLVLYFAWGLYAIISAVVMKLLFGDEFNTNILYKSFNLLLVFFVYFNLAFINSDFKAATIVKFISSVISSSAMFYSDIPIADNTNLTLYDINLIVNCFLSIIHVYYFYNGFSKFALELDNKSLYNAWKKLGKIDIILAVVSLVCRIILSLELPIASLGITIGLLILFISMLFAIAATIQGILECVFIIKTIKAISNNNEQAEANKRYMNNRYNRKKR